MNYLWISKLNYCRLLFPLVDYVHFRSTNSNHLYLAKSYTFFDCTLKNSSKHMHEKVRQNPQKDVIVGHGNKSKLQIDTTTLYKCWFKVLVGRV